MKNRLKNLTEKKWFCYGLILFVSGLICIPLFSSQINLFQDDGVQHICRFIGTEKSWIENPIFPVIMSDFCNEFGYSWNLFYSIFTAYVPLLFRFFGASYLTCLKLFLYLVTALSGFTMFAFTKRVTKNEKIALLASIFYILFPYRITDMYMRIAIAELASFIFLPMVFHGIYAIFEDCQDKEKSKPLSLILVMGTVGLILTHTVITLYTAIFAFAYVVMQYKKINKKVIWQLGISLLLVLLLTAFFLVPLLEHRLATEYEVFQKGRMSRIEVLEYYKLDGWQLIYAQTQDNIFGIGFMLLIGVVFAIIAFKKKRIELEEKRQTIFFLLLGFLCSLMTLKFFPFEKLPEILCMIQFTFRLLEFIGFFLSFVAAVGMIRLFPKFDTGDIVVMAVISFLILVPLNHWISYDTNGWKEELLYGAVPVTEETGRVHAGCASFEYLPTKAFQNLDYLIHREKGVVFLEGEAEIQGEGKEENRTYVKLTAQSNQLSVELPYIYYLGYTVKVRQAETGQWKTIPTYESEKGFLATDLMDLEEGQNYEIFVSYTGTKLMRISLMVSILTVLGIEIAYWLYFRKKRKKALEKIDET